MMKPIAPIATLVAVLICAGCGGGGNNGTGPPVQTTGTITGKVTLAGAGVAAAQVTGSGVVGTQVTDGAGNYTFAAVVAGSHTLTVTLPLGIVLAAGEPAQKSVTVVAGQTATVNWAAENGPPLSGEVTVDVRDFSYTPAEIRITRGSKVTWTNRGTLPHSATKPGTFDSGILMVNQSGSVTFATAGAFDYVCFLHSNMTGRVSVF